MNTHKYSIVVPCYNEQETIPSLLKRYEKVIGNRTDIELILVNDGSKDLTFEVLNNEKGKYKFLRIVHIELNAGYGNAVYMGLQEATGDVIGWTHGDLQTDPEDVIKAFTFFNINENSRYLYVKGRRYGRPLSDVVFTFGMSIFESILFRTLLNDINAQPNIFRREFLTLWKNPPKDFSLDLYAYLLAKRNGYSLKRFPVFFGPRFAGVSSWNTGLKSKIKFIKRTIVFSLTLLKNED